MAKRRNRKRSGGIAREDYTKGGRVSLQRGGGGSEVAIITIHSLLMVVVE